jgi:membrane fusion protein (multidrug efflux system)
MIPVRTVKLRPQSFTSYLSVTGTVRARNHIDITVEEGGTLQEVLIDKGQKAQKGQVLARLENKVLLAGFRQAEAALKQAELDFESRKVPFENKAISENEYLRSQYALDAARASFELARARLEKLWIVAPMNGLVNDRYYDIGAYANPLTRIFEFIDNEVMRIEAGLAERFLSYIQPGTPVEIGFDAYPAENITAEVSFVSRSIDPDSRTFLVEVEVLNREGKLAPQMIANMRIQLQTFEDQIVIPLDSLVQTEYGWYVFVENSGQVKRIEVQQLAIHEDRVLVHGLTAGQSLIVVGQQDLSDGDVVEVISTESNSLADDSNKHIPGS